MVHICTSRKERDKVQGQGNPGEKPQDSPCATWEVRSRRGGRSARCARNHKGALVLPRWGRAMLDPYARRESKDKPKSTVRSDCATRSAHPRAARRRRRALHRQERNTRNPNRPPERLQRDPNRRPGRIRETQEEAAGLEDSPCATRREVSGSRVTDK